VLASAPFQIGFPFLLSRHSHLECPIHNLSLQFIRQIEGGRGQRQSIRDSLAYFGLRLRRDQYYDLLQRVRTEGAWEDWLAFFVEGIAIAAQEAADTAERRLKLFEKDKGKIEELGRATPSALQKRNEQPSESAIAIEKTGERTRTEHAPNQPPQEPGACACRHAEIAQSCRGIPSTVRAAVEQTRRFQAGCRRSNSASGEIRPASCWHPVRPSKELRESRESGAETWENLRCNSFKLQFG
jgi:hypothetical protein